MRVDRHSLGIKLWLYLMLFAAILMGLLWLLQTVFLQSFYDGMKISNIKKSAETVLAEYRQGEYESAIDGITYHNAMLVIITDENGDVIYTSDEHDSGKLKRWDDAPPPDDRRFGYMRPLPRNFDEFWEKLQASNGTVSYTEMRDILGQQYIYGVRDADIVLYISTPLDPVNATTDLLRTQLLYVTLGALLLSLFIALWIARKFSQPIHSLSQKAAELAQGNFDVVFPKGFCTEIDELSLSLTHATKELSKVETLRRELIANISHDFRTPLTMIKAYVELIHDISGNHPEKREAHLRVIAEEANRLSALVDDVLELSAIQARSVEPTLTNVSLSDTVLRIIARFQTALQREGSHIDARIEPDQYVQADAARLEQVLYNLIGNAVQHIGEDHVILVRVQDRGGCVRFEVEDHGEGIPQEELPLIWDRYYKSRQSNRTVSTGLGLSIVKGILEMHAARYGVESETGKGSTFWFELRK